MTKKFHIFIASDHAGYDTKEYLMENIYKIEEAQDCKILFQDYGSANNVESVDYPDFAHITCNNFLKSDEKNKFGILICHSGIGMSMTANRYKFIRAALCYNEDAAILAKMHNNANFLVLGQKFLIRISHSLDILNSFLFTEFESGRHKRRVEKI